MKPEHVLPDFKRALDRFCEAMAMEPLDDVHRAGCIQYFEFTMPKKQWVLTCAWTNFWNLAKNYTCV